MSVAAVAVARNNQAPAIARPAPATQTQSTPRVGAMQNVATPAVTLAPVGPQSSAVQASTSLSAAPIPVAPERSGAIQKVLDKFADWSNNIPGFRMLTIVLGFNPINMRATSRDATNLLRALIELIPGGGIITQVLDSYGVINQIGAWLGKQISTLGNIGSEILAGLNRFLDSLGLSDLAPWNWGDVWDRAKQIFTAPISRLIAFGVNVATDILAMVKKVILKPLAALAKDTRGYDLLKAILGEDPITGEKVPRNAENLIGGFMKFIGQEEIWENIKKGKAIPRAWAWFQGALKDLMGFVNTVPRKIIDTLSSLTFQDILTLSGAFVKVVGVFVNIAVDFVTWGLKTTWSLLEIIFDVVKPGLMGYIKKTGAALKSIIKNPLPFIGNLVRAAKLGFDNFSDHFGTHLKNGLINWLTGSLQGVYIPTALTLPEMGKFAMSILGITWGQIRGKIVKALGPSGEVIMKGLETGFDIVVALVTGGPAAAWELIKEKLTDLKDQVVSGIISFVTDTVIKKAIPKLIAMFIPGAGFISAIISIYDTIMVFVEKVSQIIQVVVAFIDSIVAIAGGNITAAANRVEKILATMLSLAISFFAGFVGLGKVTDKILGVIEKVRASVDKALDKAVEWIVDKAKKLFKMAKGAISEWWKGKEKFTVDGETHHVLVNGGGNNPQIVIKSTEKTFLAYIGSLPDTPTNDLKKKSARELVKQIEARAKATSTEAEKALQADEKLKKLNELAKLLGELSSDEDVPASQVTYSGVTAEGGGKEMLANPLSAKHLDGDSADVNVPIYQELGNLRKGKGAPYYVQGHLLNKKLGGAGARFNLTPLTTKANAVHSTQVENVIKGWFKAPTKAKAVYYQVKAGPYYGKKSPSPNTNQVEITAEKRLVNQIECIAYVMEKKGGAWVKATVQPDKKVLNPVPND
jgi:hypothetical protein